jgi:hypothetical protein
MSKFTISKPLNPSHSRMYPWSLKDPFVLLFVLKFDMDKALFLSL